MIRRFERRSLIRLALDLIGIAVRQTPLRLPRAPCARRAPEACLERARERLRRSEAYRQGHVQHRNARLRNEPQRRDLEPATAQVVAERLAHPRSEEPVKVERRKVRDGSERVQIERLVQVLIDVLEHPVHPTFILRPAVAQRHELSARAGGRAGRGARVGPAGDRSRRAPSPTSAPPACAAHRDVSNPRRISTYLRTASPTPGCCS